MSFTCHICRKSFDNGNKLGGHLSSHNRGSEYRIGRKNDKIPKIHKCKYCHTIFENGLILGGHVTSCLQNPNRIDIIQKRNESNQNSEKRKNSISKISFTMCQRIINGSISPFSHFKNGHAIYQKCLNRKPLFYRSGLEKSIFDFLETSNFLDSYQSEILRVPYIFNDRNYYTVVDMCGLKNDHEIIVEIKPWEFLESQYKIYDGKIIPKLQAVSKYCQNNGKPFFVLSMKDSKIICIDIHKYFENNMSWDETLYRFLQ